MFMNWILKLKLFFSFEIHYIAFLKKRRLLISWMTKNCTNIILICMLFVQVMKHSSKLTKIMLVALVHELHTTGMGETTFEKVSFDLGVQVLHRKN